MDTAAFSAITIAQHYAIAIQTHYWTQAHHWNSYGIAIATLNSYAIQALNSFYWNIIMMLIINGTRMLFKLYYCNIIRTLIVIGTLMLFKLYYCNIIRMLIVIQALLFKL